MARYTGENPWWGVGYLLAQNYNRNYDQRGIEKATEAGAQALEKAKAAIEGTDYAGANAALDKISERYMNAGNALQGYEQTKAIPQGTGQNINLMLQQQPVQYEKMQGITPQRQPITPDYSFNADEFKAKYIKEQQALGRPEHQIQQALAVMEPQIKNLDEQARQKRTDETIKQLAGLAPDLDNSERLKLINSLLKDSPELGKAFLADSITNKDKWNAQKQAERDEMLTNRALALKTAVGAGSGSGVYKSPIGSPEFKYANDRIKELDEKLAELRFENENAALSPEEQAEYNQLSSYINSVKAYVYPNSNAGVFRNTERVPAADKTNWNDWDSIVRFTQLAKSKGANDEEILKAAAVKLGGTNSELYRALERSLTPEKTVIEPEEPAWYEDDNRDSLLKRIKENNYGSNGYTLFDLAHK